MHIFYHNIIFYSMFYDIIYKNKCIFCHSLVMGFPNYEYVQGQFSIYSIYIKTV